MSEPGHGRLLGATVMALSLMLLVSSSAPARSLELGLFDGAYPTSQEHALWLDRSWDAGARLVQVGVSWALIAPTSRAPGFNPADPADPGYKFRTLDGIVREASAAGFEVAFFVFGAPTWAEGPNRPGTMHAPEGTWRPDPAEFGYFTEALARRYSGAFPDSLVQRANLPHVRYFRIWNEPNLHLSPQWSNRRPISPNQYRRLLNAGYAAIKAVDRRDMVIAGGLAPYGDEPGADRMRPIAFLRRLFCLRTRGQGRARGCRSPARFDILSHNAINQFQPWRSAGHPLDVTTPDLARIKALLRAARRAGTIAPRGPKPLWVTEFWWASKPPSSFGVRPVKQARWLEYALYLFWQQRVRVAVWLGISDPEPGWDGVGFGLYSSAGEPKPALRAFRFPFIAERRSARVGSARVWGRTPAGGTVLIQRQVGRTWKTIERVRRSRAGVFTASLRVPVGAKLRAKLTPSGITSLTWTTNVAHDGSIAAGGSRRMP